MFSDKYSVKQNKNLKFMAFFLNNLKLIFAFWLCLAFVCHSFTCKHYARNWTGENGYQFNPQFQAYVCFTSNDDCQQGQTIKVTMKSLQACEPNNQTTFSVKCRHFNGCSTASGNTLKCTNYFTGENQTKNFSAIINAESSTTKLTSQCYQNYTFTWSRHEPTPDPQPNNESSWVVYVAIGGGIILAGIVVFVFFKLCKKKDDSYKQMEETNQ